MEDLISLISQILTPVRDYRGHHTEGGYNGLEYFFICPTCSGNRLSMNGNPVNPRYGQFRCFQCNYKGHAKSILKSNNISYDNSKIVVEEVKPIDFDLISSIYTDLYEHSTLLDHHKNYLISRGLDINILTPKTITNKTMNTLLSKYSDIELETAGIKKSSSEGGGVRLVAGNNRILVPYFKENKVMYIKSYGKSSFSSSKKMCGPAGIPTGKFLYGEWWIPDKINDIMLTEGEFKSASAYQAGYPCIGLPGLNSSHDKLKEFLELKEVKNLWICFDREKHENPQIEEQTFRTIKTLYDKLQFNNINIKIIVLPFDKTHVSWKSDIDSFILKNGKRAFSHIVEEAVPIDIYLSN